MPPSFTRRQSLKALSAGATLFAGSRLTAFAAAFVEGDSIAAPTESSWASFRHGPEQQGVAKTKLSAKPELKWELQSRDGWVATCAIVGDHVYAPALQGYLYCLDRETGKEIWKYRSIDNPDEKKFAPGFKAAPLVTATTVYVGDEDGLLHAVNRRTGQPTFLFLRAPEQRNDRTGLTPFWELRHLTFGPCLIGGGEGKAVRLVMM